MNIKNVLLKKKLIEIKEMMPRTNMHIDFHRENFMPESINGKRFDCIIELSLSIKDRENKDQNLVEIIVSFVIVVELEKKEKYSKRLSDSIYISIETLYQKTINDLLKEANYPPIPITIQVNAP